jgi:hypothetical protein
MAAQALGPVALRLPNRVSPDMLPSPFTPIVIAEIAAGDRTYQEQTISESERTQSGGIERTKHSKADTRSP